MSRVRHILILTILLAAPASAQNLDSLLARMTLEEKLGQLNLLSAGGRASPEQMQLVRAGKLGGLFNVMGAENTTPVQRIAVTESRLKIPLLFGLDVIHGYRAIFPIPLAEAGSFDPEAAEATARAAGQEAAAFGINWTYAPMIDIARDPRWGRIAEGGGEDPFLGYQIAKAMVKGYQGSDLTKNNTIMACVKNYALYGAAEAGRDYNTTDMTRERMYNEYLLPYKGAIDAGAGSVMSSFNEVDGIPASANKFLMTDVLRKQWGFKGFVVTDYTAVNEMIDHGMGDLQTVSALALNAGIDMDMVGEGFLTTLKRSLQEKKITQKQIDDACRRILEAKYKLGLFDNPYRYCNEQRATSEIYTDANRKAAREIAADCFVLLKNNPSPGGSGAGLLPLKKSGTIALIGPLADAKENMPGTWSVAADFSKAISLLQGLKEKVGGTVKILHAKGSF